MPEPRTFDPATGDTQATFAYDELGNRTQAQSTASEGLLGTPAPTTDAYDQASQLTRVQKASTSLQYPAVDRSFSYDGDGLRADLMWDHTAALPLVLADDQALYVTGPDGLALEQLALDGTRRYYHHDQLGSTRALTDTSGIVIARSDYDPYGNPTTTGAASNPFGYAGQYTDHTTGLIYMRARWYDPTTGQFITSDPIGHASGETNLYRYAAGDPANNVDPSGLLLGVPALDKAWDVVTSPTAVAADAIGAVADAVGVTDLADNALTFWAEVSVDECVSGGMRAVAGTAGPLAALATRDNIGTTTLVLANAAGYARGAEFGSKYRRVAPWGNRAKRYPAHPTGRYPHYHWKRNKPGGSYKRHRPWDKRQTDQGWKDRF